MERKLNILNLIRFKVLSIREGLRNSYYRLYGMSIGANTKIGTIEVNCPASVEIGNNCEVRGQTIFWVQNPFNIENRITIGDNVFIGRNVEFNCCASIIIGDNCLIASSTVFVDSSHVFFKDQMIRQQPTKLNKIVLDEDVWVGTGCKILHGVQLGKGCIIGAGSVVNKTVPPYEIWAGTPARKIGERKTSDIVV
ncbi:acyltransferase [Mucilaginibacter sp. Bleaf8]|uniref:acyltransferase n=1 Tax=Mucilaginibacter sp. Bleaf8 TaxID=2834430 RepID=UPI001BCE21A9|nr:acyltransferase [Mucilaginibacter sp. Bleaf8]MBS7566454.1 acyltransferase [Mucilaginibacter sp. Bleaf8]